LRFDQQSEDRVKRFKNIVLAAAMVGIASPAAAGPIFMGHEYEVVNAEGVTFEQARAAALALGLGWDLVSLGSAPENAFVESLLNNGLPERSHYWVGASDAAAEGVWLWLDGTPFTFTDWWGGEPNNVGGGENFLALDLRGGAWAWNDVSNLTVAGLARGFVAERAIEVAAVPEPTTLTLLGLGALTGAAARRRRRARG
jgi:hypothetical protein